MNPLVFASQSRYKKRLFDRLQLTYEAVTPAYDEVFQPGLTPPEQAVFLARGKARSLIPRFPDHVIVGSDQVISLGNRIFTKPGTTRANVQQLMDLTGQTHELHSAFSVWVPETRESIDRVITSRIRFHEGLSPQFLRQLVEQDQSQDCAGGYKLESLGIFLIASLDTPDPNAIEGLALLSLIQVLGDLGYFPSRFKKPA